MTAEASPVRIEAATSWDNCVLGYADDELISSHTLAHLCDLAGPAMEPMLAILSYVQDDTGHALRWYDLVGERLGCSVDELVFLREASAYRSAPFVDVESTDWYVVVAKNALYKVADVQRQESLLSDASEVWVDAAIRRLVERTIDEDRFHQGFWIAWARQLHDWDPQRLKAACLALARLGRSLFDLPAFWSAQHAAGLHQSWATAVAEHLPVTADEIVSADVGVARGSHEAPFDGLIEGMQQVHRAYPGGVW